jgi:hypothetical protein
MAVTCLFKMEDVDGAVDDKENLDGPAHVRETARDKRFLASVPPLPFVPSQHDHSRASGVFRALSEMRCAKEAAATSALAACPGLETWLKALLPAASPDLHASPDLLADGALVAAVALRLDGSPAHPTTSAAAGPAAALFSCVQRMALTVPTSGLKSSGRSASREHRVRRRNWELLRRGFVASSRGFLLTASDVQALSSCDDVTCVGLGVAVLARLFEYATAVGLTALTDKGTSVHALAGGNPVAADRAALAPTGSALVDPTPKRNHWAVLRRSILARALPPRCLTAPASIPSFDQAEVRLPPPPLSEHTSFASASPPPTPRSATALLPFRVGDVLQPLGLPPSKRFHFFVSHKKWHSSLGCSAEALAVLLKSVLEERGFVGCLDLDDIREITSASFRDKVAGSVCMLALLNDETAQSQW